MVSNHHGHDASLGRVPQRTRTQSIRSFQRTQRRCASRNRAKRHLPGTAECFGNTPGNRVGRGRDQRFGDRQHRIVHTGTAYNDAGCGHRRFAGVCDSRRQQSNAKLYRFAVGLHGTPTQLRGGQRQRSLRQQRGHDWQLSETLALHLWHQDLHAQHRSRNFAGVAEDRLRQPDRIAIRQVRLWNATCNGRGKLRSGWVQCDGFVHTT